MTWINVLLILLLLLNTLVLWYLCVFLVYALRPILKTPLSHRGFLGWLAGKLLFAHPAHFQVLCHTYQEQVIVYDGRNEQQAHSRFQQLQSLPGVLHIEVHRNEKLYLSWHHPSLPREQRAHTIRSSHS